MRTLSLLRSAPLAALAALLCAPSGAFAQGAQPRDIPKSEDLLKGYEVESGFYRVHRKGHRAYLEIPAQQLGRPFLLATSISGGPTYAGFQWSEVVAAWERLDERLVLVERELRYRVKNNRSPMADVVKRTFTDRVLHASPIAAMNGPNPVIDMNALLAGRAETFFGAVARRLDTSIVMIDKVKAFPQNVELRLTMPDRARDGRLTALSYSLSALPAPQSDRYRPREADERVGYFLTALRDYSDETEPGDRFVRYINRWDLQKADPSLPRSPVKDPIVFYIENSVPFRYRHAVAEGILEWNKAFEKVGLLNAVIVRQQTDTEFADLDAEDTRYNFFRWIATDRAFAMGPSRVNPWSGQILDANIIFDESMVRSYLRQYDVSLREGPREFFSPGMQELMQSDAERFWFAHHPDGGKDAAFNMLVPEADQCGVGPGVAHELSMGLLALGLEAGLFRNKGQKFPQEFVEQVVKDIVMHEVGHTIGLRHNFQASTFRSLDEINSADRPGDLAGSVMDYNPINVRIESGETQGHFSMQTIGPYDYWAIKFGYEPNEEKARADIAQVASPQFAYATDEDIAGPDPHVARWDMGSDPLQFARERLALSHQLMEDIVEKVVPEGANFDNARRAVDMLLFERQRAAVIATRFVGGQHVFRHHRGDPGAQPPLVPVAAAKQREALALVCDDVLAEGSLDLPPELLTRLGKSNWRHWGSRDTSLPHSYPFHQRILAIQAWALWGLINPETLGRLVDTEAKVAPDEDLLTIPEVFTRISHAVFGELIQDEDLSGKHTVREPRIPAAQRNLQREYARRLIDMAIEGESGRTPPSVRTIARLEARSILDRLEAILGREAALPEELLFDAYTRGHLEEIVGRLQQALEAKFQIGR